MTAGRSVFLVNECLPGTGDHARKRPVSKNSAALMVEDIAMVHLKP